MRSSERALTEACQSIRQTGGAQQPVKGATNSASSDANSSVATASGGNALDYLQVKKYGVQIKVPVGSQVNLDSKYVHHWPQAKRYLPMVLWF